MRASADVSGTGLQVEERNVFSRLDLNFALVIFALNLIGLINLYSATHGLYHNEHSDLFWKQIGWLGGGWLLFFAATLVDYRLFIRGAFIFYALNLLALLAVEVFGTTVLGATRWLDLGFFRYQPSETMKLAVILVFARILSPITAGKTLGLFRLLLPLTIVGIPYIVTAKQPDLGTASLMMATAGSMLLFIGVRKSILIVTTLIAVIAAPLVWHFGLKEYQRDRVKTFLNPGRDPRGTGYNSIQSKIAVGSGRILGKGFRKGTQSQLEFLPERHTDFIFSVLSEEHGFIGSVTTLGLFIVLYLMGIRIASQARDKVGALIVVGVLAYLFWHVFVNMCMVIGLLPIVGAPLPLLSYGGTSLLTTMAALGLVSSVAYRRYLF